MQTFSFRDEARQALEMSWMERGKCEARWEAGVRPHEAHPETGEAGLKERKSNLNCNCCNQFSIHFQGVVLVI